jgi:hypothetical protein
MEGRVNAITRGEPIEGDSGSIRVILLTEIGRQLIKMNTASSILDRAVIATLFQAMGRSIEVACLSFPLLRYDSTEEAIRNMWPDVKNASEVNMPFYPMSPSLGKQNSYCACCLHAIGSFLATGTVGVGGDCSDFMFPEYANLDSNSVSGRLTTLLHKLVPLIPELTADMTIHDLRNGSADESAFNEHCPVWATIARGNWDWKGDCQVFHYFSKKLFLSLAGKALGLWKDCRQHVTPPRLQDVLASLSSEMAAKLLIFSRVLFENCPPYFHEGGLVSTFAAVLCFVDCCVGILTTFYCTFFFCLTALRVSRFAYSHPYHVLRKCGSGSA